MWEKHTMLGNFSFDFDMIAKGSFAFVKAALKI
jgi:hypothetical protein